VYEAARQRGLRIPEDPVGGWIRRPAIARWASPPLTTIWQPLAEMGTAAAQMLGHLIEGRAPHPNRVELIVRASTSPPLSSRAASPTAGPGRRVVDPVVVPRPGPASAAFPAPQADG
jgi:hypothetical protein